ncbi:MAG: lipoprotein-releasing ABC transporter permease subunit [Pseudomonadota bacterium]
MSDPAQSSLNSKPTLASKPFGLWERTLALRYLRTKRKNGGVAIISIISFVGVMLAVMVLIVTMSIMNGFRAELVNRIAGFNGHIYLQGPAINGSGREAMLSRLRAIPGVVQAAPIVEAQAMVIGPNQVSGAIVRGMRAADVKATTLVSKTLKDGSMRGFGEGEEGGDLVLAGSGLAESLGVKAGDSMTIISASGGATAFGAAPRRKPYTVDGVFTVGMSQYDAAFVYMPLEQAQLFFGRGDSVDVIEVKLDDPDHTEAMAPAVMKAAGSGTVITTWLDRNRAYLGALVVERNAMRLILMGIVAIAAMNIISGLIMLVKNKSRDIAILRTMGASRGAVLRIFFMVGSIVGVSGALTGLVFGSLICVYIDPIQQLIEFVTGTKVFASDVYFLSRLPAKIDWGEVALVMLWSILASFVATLPPAWQAARLDPVEALRYE